MKISVVGLGKIGLPLAVYFASQNNDVIGLDIDKKVVDFVNSGVEPFPNEKNLSQYLNQVIKNKKLWATINPVEALSEAQVIVVVIPLVIEKNQEPDFTNYDATVSLIGKTMSKGSLICFETTLPIGTTFHRFTPILERESGLKVGNDFYVVFSPERVNSGRIFEDLKNYPKIVGGVTSECTLKGIKFYNEAITFSERHDLNRPNGVWSVENSTSAEFVKIAETTYRDVNIGLANEFCKFADQNKINLYEVIEAANSQPFSHIHQPGISVGGHCIPVYSKFFLWQYHEAPIVRNSRLVNESMPEYCLNILLKELINFNQKKILILGISYRPGVKETFLSGVFELSAKLKSVGAKTFVYDSKYSDDEIISLGLNPCRENTDNYDGIILHTADPDYEIYVEKNINYPCVIVDGRNFFTKKMGNHGLKILKIGDLNA